MVDKPSRVNHGKAETLCHNIAHGRGFHRSVIQRAQDFADVNFLGVGPRGANLRFHRIN
jgi:hypothetical protein